MGTRVVAISTAGAKHTRHPVNLQQTSADATSGS